MNKFFSLAGVAASVMLVGCGDNIGPAGSINLAEHLIVGKTTKDDWDNFKVGGA